jgi:uncharacterized metal-binding protein YceD (DUF177 family)
MKVHLKQIPAGETLRIEGEESADGLGLDEAGASPVGPLHYCLDVGISENGLFATGTLRLRVRLQCVVTLEDFEEDLLIDPFVIQKELHGHELVDLTPEAREDIHLALPAHPRSKAASERSPFFRSAAPMESTSDEGGNPWGVLDQLKNN